MYNKFLEYLLENDPKKVLSKSGYLARKACSPFIRNIVAPLSSKNKYHIEKIKICRKTDI